MHTHEFHGVTFHHNGDFSGEIHIEITSYKPGEPKEKIVIPFEALKEIVAVYVRNDLINWAEQAPTDIVLRHPTSR